MGFSKKAVLILGHFIQLCQWIFHVGNNGRSQNQKIWPNLHLAAEYPVGEGHLEILLLQGHVEPFIGVITDKNYSSRACLAVKILAQSISAQISVKNKNIHFRINLLEFQSAFYGLRTADL